MMSYPYDFTNIICFVILGGYSILGNKQSTAENKHEQRNIVAEPTR